MTRHRSLSPRTPQRAGPAAAMLACALTLCACAGPRPPIPLAAAVTAPEHWRGPAPAATTAAIDTNWWRGFGDPALSALVERALAQNTDLALAASRVDEARALARLARAQQAPLATAGISGGEARTVVLGRGVDALAGSPQVAISYDLDLFGRLSQASTSARASLLAAQGARDAMALAVASTTASSYIALLGLDARLATIRATLDARAEALRIARRRASLGYTSQLELQQAQSEYQATAQLVAPAELAITRQENALNLLVGEASTAVARGVGLDALTAPPIPAGLPSSLLRRRPDVASAEASLVAGDRTLDSARAALMPNLSLTGSAGWALSSALNDPITLFSLGGSLLAPPLDGGRLKAQAAAAAARRDQAAFIYRRTALTAFREVEDGLASVDRLDAQQVAIDSQIVALRETLRLAANRYREGYAPYLDQLDAQRGLLAAQLVSVQARTDRLVALVTLYQAMGGGWDASTSDPALNARPRAPGGS